MPGLSRCRDIGSGRGGTGEGATGGLEQIQRNAEFTPRNVQTVGERVRQVFGVKVGLDKAEGKLRAGMAADVFFPNVPR